MCPLTEISHDLLLDADIAAIKARNAVIEEAVREPVAVRFIKDLLSRPLLRPLFELESNGCTDLAGALLLINIPFDTTIENTLFISV